MDFQKRCTDTGIDITNTSGLVSEVSVKSGIGTPLIFSDIKYFIYSNEVKE